MSGHVRVEALVIPTIYNFLKKLLDSVPYYRPYITSECSFKPNGGRLCHSKKEKFTDVRKMIAVAKLP